MVESSLPWGGIVTGDAILAPYSDDQWSDMYRKMFIRDRTVQGVVGGYANELEVTDAGGTTIRVATGIALVDGKFYENTVNVDNASSGNTVYWLVGLQKDFAGQEVRIFARGPYASEAAALLALIQTDGVIWEIPLATVLTDAAGDVDVVTDQRVWVLRPLLETIFIPCGFVYNRTDPINEYLEETAIGLTGVKMQDAKNSEAHGWFILPANYYSDLTVKAVLFGGNGNNIYAKMVIAVGECGGTVGSIGIIEPAFAQEAVESNDGYHSCQMETTIDFTAYSGNIVLLTFVRDAVDVLDTVNQDMFTIGFYVTYKVR
ncbi:hypothetical protein LCGC14_0466560 [marine sediment metagenome]|uniref:Uncharacterized protein n=1 Tax=marine sediment metagenome TaxID=412755 RepID=A0A0F9V0E0_9ZZZZ